MKRILPLLLIASLYACKKDENKQPEPEKNYTFSLTAANTDFLKSAKITLKKGQLVLDKEFTVNATSATAVIDALPEPGEWTVEVEVTGVTKEVEVEDDGTVIKHPATLVSTISKSYTLNVLGLSTTL